MAEFLTTYATSHHIEKIIKGAISKLVLVSPYLQLSRTFFERLKDASAKGVSIKIIYGKSELRDDQMKQLAELKGLELFYFENLHAKCYMNENTMVITSMNMYDFSEKNNREMGVLIEREKDTQVFKDAMDETKSIIDSSVKKDFTLKNKQVAAKNPKYVETKTPKYAESKSPKYATKKGYCIRCRTAITLNPDRPLCEDCYGTWSIYENIDFREQYCHGCGDPGPSSFRYPQCQECYSSYSNTLKLTM